MHNSKNTSSFPKKEEKQMRNLGTPVHVFQVDFLEKPQFKFSSNKKLFNYCYCCTTTYTECFTWILSSPKPQTLTTRASCRIDKLKPSDINNLSKRDRR